MTTIALFHSALGLRPGVLDPRTFGIQSWPQRVPVQVYCGLPLW